MTFIIIVSCLIAQYFFSLRSAKVQINWLAPYLRLVASRFPQLVNLNSQMNHIILFVPLAVLITLLFLLLNLFGNWGTWIVGALSVLLLWYSTDLTKFTSDDAQTYTPNELINRYVNFLFVPLFWYAIIHSPLFYSPLFLTFYIIFRQLDIQAKAELAVEESVERSSIFISILNWIPVRLIGLSLAAVSNFQPIIAKFAQTALSRLSAVEFLRQLLSVAVSSEATLLSNDASSSVSGRLDTVVSQRLFLRTLLLWLGVLLLVSVVMALAAHYSVK